MKHLHIRSASLGLLLIGLLSGGGYYFFWTEPAGSVSVPSTHTLELPLNFPDSNATYSLLTPEEQKASVSKYDHLIRAACRKYSLDPALVKAIIHTESRFDPWAVSPKGAMGLMQIDPVTARELGINDPFDPKKNIDGGVRYLKELLDAFGGNTRLALAAYNAGPNRVFQHKGIPPYKDTRRYIAQVFRYQFYYRQTERAG